MQDEAVPGRGKLLQLYKLELRALKTEAKRAISKARSKEEKTEAEQKYAEQEQQLLLRQQQLLQMQSASLGDRNGDTREAAADAAVSTEAQMATSPKAQPTDAEKAAIESLEGLSLYKPQAEGRKLSKAQRRREKKHEEMRERERNFEKSRAGKNIGDVEFQHLQTELQTEGFSIFSIPADGNCLFRSIVHQLQQSGSEGGGLDVKGLRHGIANVLLEDRDSFKPFLDEELQQDAAYDAFCENIRSSQDWGGEIELHAATKLLRRPIRVFSYSDSVHTITYGEDEFKEAAPLLLVFHRHLLAAGPHYNSVVPLPEIPDLHN